MSGIETRYIYRAKELQMGKFVYGAYLKFLPYTPYPVGDKHIPETDYKHLIITEGFSDWGLPRELKVYEIDPDTLGQCTGIKDKNGNLIYEGDIVKFNYDTVEIKAVVSWDNKDLIGFYLNATDYFKDKYVSDYDFYKNDYEIIGSIYENPELLEVSK